MKIDYGKIYWKGWIIFNILGISLYLMILFLKKYVIK